MSPAPQMILSAQEANDHDMVAMGSGRDSGGGRWDGPVDAPVDPALHKHHTHVGVPEAESYSPGQADRQWDPGGKRDVNSGLYVLEAFWAPRR